MVEPSIQVERKALLEMVRTGEFSPAQYVLLSWLVDVLWDPRRPFIKLTQTQVADEGRLDPSTTRAMIRALRNAGVLRCYSNNNTGKGKIVINPELAWATDEEVLKRQRLHWFDLSC